MIFKSIHQLLNRFQSCDRTMEEKRKRVVLENSNITVTFSYPIDAYHWVTYIYSYVHLIHNAFDMLITQIVTLCVLNRGFSTVPGSLVTRGSPGSD